MPGCSIIGLHRFFLMYFQPVTVPAGVSQPTETKKATETKKSDNDHSTDHDQDEEDDEEEDEEQIPDDLSDTEPSAKRAKKSKAGDGEDENDSSRLLTEKVERRASTTLPPLLSRLGERKPEKLNYIGVSFGATPKLIKFWKKAGYLPVYLRQTMVRA